MRPAVIANSDVLRLCDGRIVLSWPEMSLTWWRAVIPDMLIRSRSISTLALLSMFMIASPSLSLMWSSNTTSSGNLTLRLPGLSLAKTLALRDMPQLSPVTLSRIEAVTWPRDGGLTHVSLVVTGYMRCVSWSATDTTELSSQLRLDPPQLWAQPGHSSQPQARHRRAVIPSSWCILVFLKLWINQAGSPQISSRGMTPRVPDIGCWWPRCSWGSAKHAHYRRNVVINMQQQRRRHEHNALLIFTLASGLSLDTAVCSSLLQAAAADLWIFVSVGYCQK